MKKQNNMDFQQMARLFSLAFLPFLIFSIIHYIRLQKIFPVTESTQRIFDFGSVLRPLMLGGGVLVILLFAWQNFHNNLTIMTIIIFMASVILYKVANLVASSYYGVVVDYARNIILLPIDMINYTLTDYMQLKFIRQLGDMEYVNLSDIKRITREKGKSLYIHGDFGSRGIHFSNKQKRDECISAIQSATKVSIIAELESGY